MSGPTYTGIANAGIFALAGAQSYAETVGQASAGSFTLTGIAASGALNTYSGWYASDTTVLASYTTYFADGSSDNTFTGTAEAGTFALIGPPAGAAVLNGRAFVGSAAAGTFSLTGLAASSSLYTYSGWYASDTTVLASYTNYFADGSSTVVFTGTAAAGVFGLTGIAAAGSLIAAGNFTGMANTGVYSLVGVAANGVLQFSASANAGVFALSGRAAAGSIIPVGSSTGVAVTGMYSLTGNAAVGRINFTNIYQGLAAAGIYVLDGIGAIGFYNVAQGMPNVVGIEYLEALQQLQAANVINPAKLGYFGTYPVTIDWLESSAPPGTVLLQSVVAGSFVTVNMPVKLTVSQFPTAVAFP